MQISRIISKIICMNTVRCLCTLECDERTKPVQIYDTPDTSLRWFGGNRDRPTISQRNKTRKKPLSFLINSYNRSGDLFKPYYSMCLAEYFFKLVSVCVFRHAYPGEPAAGHSADVGQRPPPLLLRLLHLRHHRSPAVGGASEEPLLPRGELHSVSHCVFIRTSCLLCRFVSGLEYEA